MHKIETKQLAFNDAPIFTEFDALFDHGLYSYSPWFDIITADWSEIYVTFSLEWCAKSIYISMIRLF